MKQSIDRIITTHVGSLPRPERLEELLIQRDHGRHVDQAEFDGEVERALEYAIGKQIESGVDVGNDGEEPRVGFQTYVPQRMSGFAGTSPRKMLTDMVRFPKYAKMFTDCTWSPDRERPKVFNAPQATEKIQYEADLKDAKYELAAFRKALDKHAEKRRSFLETFVTAATPGIVSTTMLRAEGNPAYPSDREYVIDLAHEMKKEYDFIISQGHVLQLDSPDLAMERQFMFQDRPLKEFLERIELHVEALNLAVANIPKEKVRLHVCYGNWDGPHIDDVDLEPLLPILYQAKVGAISMAFANPRHQHDSKTIKKHPLPKEMILLPGVIDVTTNYLEHPEVVADRICQWVDVVGDRERVIASTDCGFGTFAGYTFVAEDVVWAKLRTLRDGAKIASERIWGHKSN
jgi:5-methyltetrahydropteroyltriglutamate--homocysteine methyltransferase